MPNINPLSIPLKNYRKRSSFSNVKNRISKNYSNSFKPKSLQEIQEDEIKSIRIKNQKLFEFFQVFNNPYIVNLDKAREQSFDLKQEIQLNFPKQDVFTLIITPMIQLFQNDVKDIKKLKISSEMIRSIQELKTDLMSKVLSSFVDPKQSLFQKFKEFASMIKQKIKGQQEPVSQQITETAEVELLTQIFFNIISTLQKLKIDTSPMNIAVFLNAPFTLSIGQIFGIEKNIFPEFKTGALRNLAKMPCRFNLLSLAVFLGIEPLIVLFLLLGANPSLINQYHQDASYHILFFQMIFRNIAMNVGWKPRGDKQENGQFRKQTTFLNYDT